MDRGQPRRRAAIRRRSSASTATRSLSSPTLLRRTGSATIEVSSPLRRNTSPGHRRARRPAHPVAATIARRDEDHDARAGQPPGSTRSPSWRVKHQETTTSRAGSPPSRSSTDHRTRSSVPRMQNCRRRWQRTRRSPRRFPCVLQNIFLQRAQACRAAVRRPARYLVPRRSAHRERVRRTRRNHPRLRRLAGDHRSGTGTATSTTSSSPRSTFPTTARTDVTWSPGYLDALASRGVPCPASGRSVGIVPSDNRVRLPGLALQPRHLAAAGRRPSHSRQVRHRHARPADTLRAIAYSQACTLTPAGA